MGSAINYYANEASYTKETQKFNESMFVLYRGLIKYENKDFEVVLKLMKKRLTKGFGRKLSTKLARPVSKRVNRMTEVELLDNFYFKVRNNYVFQRDNEDIKYMLDDIRIKLWRGELK